MESRSDGTRVIATFRARPGMEARLLEVLSGLIEPTRAEEGCRLYELWRNRANTAEFTFVEEWSSDEALNEHSRSAHITDARARYLDLIDGAVDLRRYDRAD